jgi:hypothetical protein
MKKREIKKLISALTEKGMYDDFESSDILNMDEFDDMGPIELFLTQDKWSDSYDISQDTVLLDDDMAYELIEDFVHPKIPN